MSHIHKKTKQYIFTKKNTFTLITYCIAACVILICITAAVLGITENNKSTDSEQERTEQTVPENSNNESDNYTHTDSETDNYTDSDDNDDSKADTDLEADYEIPFSLFE